jgi:hypothetical protein
MIFWVSNEDHPTDDKMQYVGFGSFVKGFLTAIIVTEAPNEYGMFFARTEANMMRIFAVLYFPKKEKKKYYVFNEPDWAADKIRFAKRGPDVCTSCWSDTELAWGFNAPAKHQLVSQKETGDWLELQPDGYCRVKCGISPKDNPGEYVQNSITMSTQYCQKCHGCTNCMLANTWCTGSCG